MMSEVEALINDQLQSEELGGDSADENDDEEQKKRRRKKRGKRLCIIFSIKST